MRSIDYHMHTRFSGDSEADPREHVIQAIKMGLDEICFTDHRDFDYPIDVFDLDVEGYYQTIMALKKEFADKIIIGRAFFSRIFNVARIPSSFGIITSMIRRSTG